MSHHYPTDLQSLGVLLESRAPYIGVLGPRRRTERLLDELFSARPELAGRDLSRVYAPLGLDLGAQTPVQIALSAIAEMQAVLAQGSALPLSVRGARPIHRPISELTLSAPPVLAKTGTA